MNRRRQKHVFHPAEMADRHGKRCRPNAASSVEVRNSESAGRRPIDRIRPSGLNNAEPEQSAAIRNAHHLPDRSGRRAERIASGVSRLTSLAEAVSQPWIGNVFRIPCRHKPREPPTIRMHRILNSIRISTRRKLRCMDIVESTAAISPSLVLSFAPCAAPAARAGF